MVLDAKGLADYRFAGFFRGKDRDMRGTILVVMGRQERDGR